MKILNANPGVGAPLTEQQTKDFLTTSKLNIHIGTVDEKVMQTFIQCGTIMTLQTTSFIF